MSSDIQEQEGYSVNSSTYTEDALRLKLDPTDLLQRIENFLKGKAVTIKDNKYVTVSTGKPLANSEGVQAILNTISMIINKDCVMGNLSDDEIRSIILDIKKDMAYDLMTKCDDWDIDRKNRLMIAHNVEKLARIFLSRTKDNKERESLN